MKNHFHLLVNIKDNIIYKLNNTDKSIDPVSFETNKWETIPKPDSVTDLAALNNKKLTNLAAFEENKTPNPTKHFSHLFNAYSKYYNNRYSRHGSLFERAFKRKQIDSEEYLKQVILYIHNNPVIHGFCNSPIEYPWSSYLTCISDNQTNLKRNKVIKWFNDKENFKYCHQTSCNYDNLEFSFDLK
jgi:REP element-mobilizing transposase RayT